MKFKGIGFKTLEKKSKIRATIDNVYNTTKMRSEKSYNFLFRILVVMFLVEILAGIVIALICEYVKLFIQSHFFQIDKHEVQSVIFIIKLYGLHISICYCCGLTVIMLFNDVYTRHLGILINLWMFLTIESAIGCLFTTWLFVDSMSYVSEKLEISLVNGLNLYPKDPHWVLIWDDLQYDYKCCGVHNHTDWMNIKFRKDDVRLSKEVSSWLPFSCACGNVPIRTNLSDDNIYTKGCFLVISEIIELLISVTVGVNALIGVMMVSMVDSESHNFLSFNCIHKSIFPTTQILIIIMIRTVFAYKRIYTEIPPDFESEEVSK